MGNVVVNSGRVVSFKQTTQETHGQCCCDFGNVAVFEIGQTTNHGYSPVDTLLDGATKNMEFGKGYMKHVVLSNIQHKNTWNILL